MVGRERALSPNFRGLRPGERALVTRFAGRCGGTKPTFATADDGTVLALFTAFGRSVCLARVGSRVVVHTVGEVLASALTVGTALAALRGKLPPLFARPRRVVRTAASAVIG